MDRLNTGSAPVDKTACGFPGGEATEKTPAVVSC